MTPVGDGYMDIESETCEMISLSVMFLLKETYIIQELRPSIPFDIVRVEITPPKLNIDPVFIARRSI